MAHFVRCIDGHVFDAATAAVCPTCGATVEVAPTAAISGEALVPEMAAPGPAFPARTPLLAAVAVLCLGVGIGSLYFVLRESRSPSTTGGQPASAAAPTPKESAAPAAAPPDQNNRASTSANATAPSTPAPATSTPDDATSAADANISQTLRTTLDVVRMLVAFGQEKYTDALSLADPLIGENNPIGMFIKAGLFMDGLGGQPKDLTQARDLLAKATQLGDPTSALFYARVLENGIGGPRDLNAAKENYLFAARGMTAGADQDLARLHLSGDVGMTALQAYQNLVSPQRTKDALARFNDLMKAYSTSAVCLYGWIYSQAEALHWTATRGSGDIAQLHGVDAKKMAAPPSNAGGQPMLADAQEVQRQQLQYFAFGAARSDPWCEWGMAMRAAKGSTAYPKNLVEADLFYRLATINAKLGSGVGQVKQELAAVEGQMTPREKQQADSLFHGAVPASMAP
jgi:TPR repeat protein